MKREKFNDILQANMQAIEEFRYAAATVHDDTHHTYDGHPYSHHLSMVANMTYSFHGANESNSHMHRVYESEWPHFIGAITVEGEDQRFALSAAMKADIEALFNE